MTIGYNPRFYAEWEVIDADADGSKCSDDFFPLFSKSAEHLAARIEAHPRVTSDCHFR